MKIYLCSDMHLEFGDYRIENNDGVDVLILAGDICLARAFADITTFGDEHDAFEQSNMRNKFNKFFRECSEKFPHVLYVLGNHEFYRSDINHVYGELVAAISRYDNIHVMERESISISDIRFHACTLWTDFNKHDVLTMHDVPFIMNDYRMIYDGFQRLSSEKIYSIHQSSMKFLVESLNYSSQRNVVVTHHAPSFKSIDVNRHNGGVINGAYASDLSDFILDNSIDLWCHGHTHNRVDYLIGDTRVVSNPRGYSGVEKLAESFKPQLINI